MNFGVFFDANVSFEYLSLVFDTRTFGSCCYGV